MFHIVDMEHLFLYLNFKNILHNCDYEVYTGLVLLVL